MEFRDDCPCADWCPMDFLLKLIGGKWKMKIICALNVHRVVRYGQLKKLVVGINATMLANSLRELEDSGIVLRAQYDTMPVRVEYQLTDAGKSLIPILEQLRDWSAEYADQIGYTGLLSSAIHSSSNL